MKVISSKKYKYLVDCKNSLVSMFSKHKELSITIHRKSKEIAKLESELELVRDMMQQYKDSALKSSEELRRLGDYSAKCFVANRYITAIALNKESEGTFKRAFEASKSIYEKVL